MYRIMLDAPTVFVPCKYVPSKNAPGKILCCRDSDGASMVVEPNGTQVRWEPATSGNFDSSWTQGTPLSGFLVFRSANGADPGKPYGFRMVA